MDFDKYKVVYAKRSLKVIPTEADRCKAIPGDRANCVLAIALKKAYPGCIEAEVSKTRAYVRIKRVIYVLSTPRANNFQALLFDKTGDFQTGDEYYFTPVCPSGRATGKRQGAVKTKGAPRLKPNAKKRFKHKFKGVRPDIKR
jgi:hypothetical protein